MASRDVPDLCKIVFLRRALSSLDLLVSLVIHQHLELAAVLN